MLSMMSDRLNIERSAFKHSPAWPELIFSVQSLLNVPANAIGASCYGCGRLDTVLKYIKSHGVPVESCQLYLADDSYPGNAMHECQYCNNPIAPSHCYPAEEYTAYSFSEWGSMTPSADRMKESIYQHGPIVCGMDATPQFQEYGGGIFSQLNGFPNIDHYVEIVGWGRDDSNGTETEYWIGKNSWGQYWGERGLFRIKMHSDNLGIETDCHYGIPEERK